MTKKERNLKELRRMRSLERYSANRRTEKWKNRKKSNLNKIKRGIIERKRRENQDMMPYIEMVAPEDFSLVRNTDEVLEYFTKIKYHTKLGKNITIDISNVSNITTDSIELLAAVANHERTERGVTIRGNAPNNVKLKKLFQSSGFYNFVSTDIEYSQNENDQLHKQRHYKFQPSIIKNSAILLRKNLNVSHIISDAVSNTLSELMENTDHHANPEKEASVKWWLYSKLEEEERMVFSFLDLGVGIFESAPVKGYINNILKSTGLSDNSYLAKELLHGRIKSRSRRDNEIRGKGLPEILNNAKLDKFSDFYIISNNIKIDLKTHKITRLKHNLRGTLIRFQVNR